MSTSRVKRYEMNLYSDRSMTVHVYARDDDEAEEAAEELLKTGKPPVWGMYWMPPRELLEYLNTALDSWWNIGHESVDIWKAWGLNE